MGGTSSRGDKLTGDFGNEPDATSISDRGLFRLSGGKFVTRRLGLLQQNRHGAADPECPLSQRVLEVSGRATEIVETTFMTPEPTLMALAER